MSIWMHKEILPKCGGRGENGFSSFWRMYVLPFFPFVFSLFFLLLRACIIHRRNFLTLTLYYFPFLSTHAYTCICLHPTSRRRYFSLSRTDERDEEKNLLCSVFQKTFDHWKKIVNRRSCFSLSLSRSNV